MFKSTRTKSRRLVLTLLSATVVVGLAAGCSSPTAPTAAPGTSPTGQAPAPTENVELTFVYKGDNSQQEAFNSLFAEFNKQHPEITLKAQGVAADNWAIYANTIATRLAGGQDIDIIQMATEGQRLFASKGILEPLEPYLERDKEIADDYFNDISPRLRDFNQKFASDPDGNMVFVPGGFSTWMMYANTELFEEAGVPVPADGNWTWDEFLDAGIKIKEKTGAYITRVNNSYFAGAMPWLTTNGTSAFNEDWTQPTFNTPQAVEAAKFARQLVELGLSPEPGGQFDNNVAYEQGQLATIGGGRFPTTAIRSMDMVDQTVVLNWPMKATQGTPLGWDAWTITKNSKNKDAAWTFMKFLMSKEAGQYFASIGGTIIPARVSVATSSYFTDNAPAHSERLAEGMDYGTPIPTIDRGPEAQTVIEEAWMTIITGQGDPQATLDEAQAALEALVA